MPNPSMPHPPSKHKFLQLIQELQAEYELLHSAFRSEEAREVQASIPVPKTPQRENESASLDQARKLKEIMPTSIPSSTKKLNGACGSGDLDVTRSESKIEGTIDTSRNSSVQLTPDRIEQLQFEFDKLDDQHEDRIPLEKVVDVVEEYAREPIDRDKLYSVLDEICDHPPEGASPSASQGGAGSLSMVSHASGELDGGKYMNFDDFLYMMTVPTTKAASDNENVAYASLAQLQKAFRNFAVSQKEVDEIDRQEKEKFLHIGVLLDLVPAPVIIINSLVMGFQADAPDSAIWKIFDLFFFSFYVGEAFVKCYLLGCGQYFCGKEKMWNWFDLLCISISAFDITYETILPLFVDNLEGSQVGELMLMKMMRLAKLGRLVKALHYPFFKELKLMVNGVMSGMRVLLWAIVLLVVVIFFLGVCARNLISHIDEFGSVPAAMFTIFRCFTDGCSAYDGTPLQERLRTEYGATFMLPYVGIFMFVTFGLFNLIMAIFINNVQSTEEERLLQDLGLTARAKRLKFEALLTEKIIYKKQNGKRQHLLDPRLRRELVVAYKEDPHLAYQRLPQDLEISGKVFDTWLEDEDLIELLEESEIQTSNLHELFDVLDADMSGQLTVVELVNGLMRLRGPITKSEMVALRMKIRLITQELQRVIAKICPKPSQEELMRGSRIISHEGLQSHMSNITSAFRDEDSIHD